MQVHWTSIARRAGANGLRVAGFTDQHHFLTGIISTWPDLLRARSPAALQTLLHPEMLGRAFQVLALTKDIDRDRQQLAGLKFGGDPRAALGSTR
jgi:SAM-dependent MidA family methyltransferase